MEHDINKRSTVRSTTHHTAMEWVGRLNLTRKGRAWVGTCPICDVVDRLTLKKQPGRLGCTTLQCSVCDLRDGDTWTLAQDRAFPEDAPRHGRVVRGLYEKMSAAERHCSN